ncbi:putative aldouronate transport system permease protein [Paenibacillus sp. UNCCL117]|uniref:ABC transporter permease n=1 Tax=unclassified Paenibacillus TaxID=185978 RepID=UPI000884084C|nr:MULTISPECIES: ABC transporter permease subunit [unclassified Paenibacillus]SDD76324.1 putative aldouronate transport system permease protein [Paenibacillus sp. cl123]SFW52409.1 putative aldouronate transport system permease protein [Paenibacillus sp. UNCCL117]
MQTIRVDLKRHWATYLMAIPVIAYYLIFHYGPMYGLQIAFKDFSTAKGIWGSAWVGFDHFNSFFNGIYFWRLLKNTILINLYELIFGFPAAIILALLLNEIRQAMFKRLVQTISYLPHFISIVVVAGMMVDFLSRTGLINQILGQFGVEPIDFLKEEGWFRFLFVSSGIWQGIGWGSIIYLAAIATIDPTLYEAARMDGANRWKQVLHVTIPGIMPTIVILFILNMGNMLTVGSEKVLLLYNPLTYETADVISTYVYRKGILESSYSFTAAVGLFNSIVSFILIVAANSFSKRISENKLW